MSIRFRCPACGTVRKIIPGRRACLHCKALVAACGGPVRRCGVRLEVDTTKKADR